MNLLKWLKSKSGKLPVSLAQAAGLTAVVGAAGFAAFSYLNSPSDNATAFIPPSVYEQQGDVVYVSQNGGGGNYESNGEVGSSFRALPSRSIQLANQQAARESQARELEESNVQPAYAGQEAGAEDPSLKAFQLSGGDLGLGMGSTGDKQKDASLASAAAMTSLQNQLANVGNAISSAQAQAAGAAANGAAAGGAAGAAGAKGVSGQTAAQLANAPRNWGQGSGGSSGVSNSFAIQNSGRNAKEISAELAKAGDVMADAQAALASMQKEGSRMRSRASFGPSDGLGKDRDGEGTGARARYGNARSELDWIRKQSAKINSNSFNAANAGGAPFMASAKITGGIRVEGDLTTGQGASSGDLSTADKQMRGVKAKLGQIQSSLEERTKSRHELRKWMWIALPLALVMIPVIGALAAIGRMHIPFVSAIARILSFVAAALTLIPVIKLLTAGISYTSQYGGDFFSIFSTVLGGTLTAGVATALLLPSFGSWLSKLPMWTLGAAAGVGFGGATIFHFLSKKGEGYTDEQLDDNSSKDSLK